MKTIKQRMTLVIVSGLLTACSSPTPNLDAHFGESIADIQKMQILNPGAERNAAVPVGIDGRAGYSGYEQYQKSFKAPEPKTNVFTIGLGR